MPGSPASPHQLWLCRCFVALRCLLLLSPGYIHPDEFFQSGQDYFATEGSDAFLPWEFTAAKPLRSFVPILVTTIVPLQIARTLTRLAMPLPVPWSLVALVVPRVVVLSISFFTDKHIKTVIQQLKTHQAAVALVLYQSAWPTLLFASRPFSNTLEAALLTYLIFLTVEEEQEVLDMLRIGVVLAIGVWCRFTFLCFSLPVMLHWTVREFRKYKCKHTYARRIAAVVLGAGLASSLCVLIDTIGYSYMYWHPYLEIVIAPVNGFMYNSQTQNLREHGLHSRATHVCVNVPLLTSPIGLAALLVALYTRIRACTQHTDPNKTGLVNFAAMCSDVCTVGLVLLSIAPHQEPRFLLPLVFPFCVVIASTFVVPPMRLWYTWSICMTVVFGFLHQGGLLPSMVLFPPNTLESTPTQRPPNTYSHTIIFYHTYMPPRFLLTALHTHPRQHAPRVIDLASASPSTLARTFESQLTPTITEELWLVTAASAPFPYNLCFRNYSTSTNCVYSGTLHMWWPHFSGEDPIPLLNCIYPERHLREHVPHSLAYAWNTAVCALGALKFLTVHTYKISLVSQ